LMLAMASNRTFGWSISLFSTGVPESQLFSQHPFSSPCYSTPFQGGSSCPKQIFYSSISGLFPPDRQVPQKDFNPRAFLLHPDTLKPLLLRPPNLPPLYCNPPPWRDFFRRGFNRSPPLVSLAPPLHNPPDRDPLSLPPEFFNALPSLPFFQCISALP